MWHSGRGTPGSSSVVTVGTNRYDNYLGKVGMYEYNRIEPIRNQEIRTKVRNSLPAYC